MSIFQTIRDDIEAEAAKVGAIIETDAAYVGKFLEGFVKQLYQFELEAAKAGIKGAGEILLDTVTTVVQSARTQGLSGSDAFSYVENTLRGDLPGMVGKVEEGLLNSAIETATRNLPKLIIAGVAAASK